MSYQQQPPVAPQPSPGTYQPPKEPEIKARTVAMVFGVILIVILAVVLVVIVAGGTSNSPKGAMEGYVDGINAGDAKAAFDHTVMKFMPGYEQQISSMGSMLLAGGPHIVIQNITEIDNSSMTPSEMQDALDLMNEVLAFVNITVEDMAFVEYNMTLQYTSYGIDTEPMHGQMLCVKVDGHWYLATVTFFD